MYVKSQEKVHSTMVESMQDRSVMRYRQENGRWEETVLGGSSIKMAGRN